MKKRRSERKNGKNIAIIVCIVALAILLISGGAIVMNSYTGQKKLDENYCIADANQHKTAIFIDSSVQQLSTAHLRDYRTVFEQAYELTPVNTKIMVFTTASHTNGSLVKPVYIHCKPAMTAQEQANLGLPEKPLPYIKRQVVEAEKTYHAYVETILSDVQNQEKSASQSPILEQFRAVQSSEFQGSSKSLTIITDGIHNSVATGMFCLTKGATPAFKNFAQRSDYELAFKPKSFAGTDVSILLVEQVQFPIPEMPYCTTNEIRHF